MQVEAEPQPKARRFAEGPNQHSQILRYWRSVELFSATDVESLVPKSQRHVVTEGKALPWKHRGLKDKRVWQHCLYGGVFDLQQLHQVCEAVFGTSGPDLDEHISRGSSALFAVLVSEEGYLLPDSLVLSSAAWALGRVRNLGTGDPAWLEGFEAAARTFSETVYEQVSGETLLSIPTTRRIDYECLVELVELAAEQLGVSAYLDLELGWIRSEPLSSEREPQTEFLNSFYLHDLARIEGEVHTCGPALATYLGGREGERVPPRIDIRDKTQQAVLLENLAPQEVPQGRWPAKNTHSLATSQQLAVNAILKQFRSAGGIFSVNGPPGTGKTTMLRDLVAAVVVERASQLASLATPTDGFEDARLVWRTNDYARWVHQLKPQLAGFEMLVASANNAAVENVTKEIPLQRAIDPQWASEAQYFAKQASWVLGEPAWGMVAAKLGNKANCVDFVNRFWFGNLGVFSKIKEADGDNGFEKWLRGMRDGRLEVPSWPEAVAAFQTAVAQEERLRKERQAAHEACQAVSTWHQRIKEQQSVRRKYQRQGEDTSRRFRAYQTKHAEAEHALLVAKERRATHRSHKPSFWETLFTLGFAIRRWHKEDELLAREEMDASSLCRVLGQELASAKQAVEAAILEAKLVDLTETQLRENYEQARERIEAVRLIFGSKIPDDEWYADRSRREIDAPWLDEQWNDARVRVFLAALNLHHAFVAGAASMMYGNLKAAMDVLHRRVPTDAKSKDIQHAWQSLFVMVPVVSTTFASMSRLMGAMEAESAGWLFIDEAGQSLPQAAVGAIWRSRRVVVVGDPLQLEPIAGILHSTGVSLAAHHQVSEAWHPGRTSVQTLADRGATIGTRIPCADGDDVWVGSPLVVHRRCACPMFPIMNSAVYGGLMVYGTPEQEAPLPLRESTWIDIKSVQSEGHWIPEEGEAVLEVLAYLDKCGVSGDKVMILSPFRDAAERMQLLLKEHYRRRYPEQLIPANGTIHTAQGKEADVVLFVLGGSSHRPGARQWASSKPNLFNVAISRAKKRLYVLGSYEHWSHLPYFCKLASELAVRPLRSQVLAKTSEIEVLGA